MDFVVIAEHPPDLCPKSNAVVRKQAENFPMLYELAKAMGAEIVFHGIPVPEHKIFMVLRAPDFETVRRLMVESRLVQTNTIHIYQTESFEEFMDETRKIDPMF
jgi:hypothetical protein